MTRKKIGVLLMAYGTPKNKAEIEPYYTHIRRGKKPPKHLLDELIQRYEMVKEINQFAKITDEQLRLVVAQLNEQYPDVEFIGYLGLKHIAPFIETAVEQIHNDRISDVVSLVLAPHYSSLSVQVYNERARKKADEYRLRLYSVEQWYDQPSFIQFWADRLNEIFEPMDEAEREKSVVIFSAHSLPTRILKIDDPYPKQLEETAKLIAQKVAIPNYRLGWQSAGNTPEPWLGPDVKELTQSLFHQEGFRSFIYCPIGFVAEHMEVLYDNDVECKAVTEELGARYYRPVMPNTHPLLIDALTQAIREELIQKGVLE